MASCSAIDLADIILILAREFDQLITVLGRPGRGASQVEKSPRLNWTTQVLTVAYDGACSPNVSVRVP